MWEFRTKYDCTAFICMQISAILHAYTRISYQTSNKKYEKLSCLMEFYAEVDRMWSFINHYCYK